MSAGLVGAWLLAPGHVSERLGLRERHALRSVYGAVNRVTEVERGRLWLLADAAQLVEDTDGVLAAVGLVASETGSLCEVYERARWRPRWEPEGHFALARADLRRGSLELARSVSGGERLYYVTLGELLLFADSLRLLFAHRSVERAVDPNVLREVLLTGHVTRGSATLIRGIEEVLPGHTARVDRTLEQHWHCLPDLRSAEGSRAELSRQFRERLCDGIARSIGRERPVALALSGGIDSSAIAAALVEVVGADQVHAFSYEFDDPTHPVETDYARSVARRLGIQRHDVFPIRFAEFLDAIPEHVWRSESSVHWPKAFLLCVARQIRARGFDRYLTGFGIGSHMGYLAELAELLPWLPKPELTLRYWSKVRFEGWDLFSLLARLHPGLEPPHPRLFHFLLEQLEARGMISDRRGFYPVELAPLLAARRPRARGGLCESMQLEAIAHLISCIDVTRSEKASRELGVLRVSPAHFAGCLRYAYFPPEPAPNLFGAERRLRPGKLLLREAYRGVLPDEVLFRRKSWDDAVVSRAWRKRGRVFMLRALPHHPGDYERFGPDLARAVEHYEPQSIQAGGLALRLWLRLFVERPPTSEPPTWRELWGNDPALARAGRGAALRSLSYEDQR
jgi:asparagine synthetase B (glutamine-hydrolysing)